MAPRSYLGLEWAPSTAVGPSPNRSAAVPYRKAAIQHPLMAASYAKTFNWCAHSLVSIARGAAVHTQPPTVPGSTLVWPLDTRFQTNIARLLRVNSTMDTARALQRRSHQPRPALPYSHTLIPR